MPDQVVFSKSDYAYAEVKRRILSDEMPPGSVIGQEALAAELAISTTPVREALKRLASEGLVRLETHHDARVTEVSAEEARHLYEVRQSLDPLAVGLAAERRTEADARAIEKALHNLRPLSGVADLGSLVAHREFHRSIYRASQNLPLTGILEGLWDKADRYRQVGLRARRVEEAGEVSRVQAEHEALAAAVLQGDPGKAREVMSEHIARSLGRHAIKTLEGDGRN